MALTVRDPLLMPVGALAARVEPLQPEDSIQAAARTFHELGVSVLPVAIGRHYVGSIAESQLLLAHAQGAQGHEPIASLIHEGPPGLPPGVSGAEALRIFAESGAAGLPVVDATGEYVGWLTPARLMHPPATQARPRMVGGMATPFGVYLTNGGVSGGVGPLALVATGMMLFGLFLVAGFVALAIVHALPPGVQSHPWISPAFQGSILVLFMLGMRILPISGIHAAEHMTVHAIERGEELRPEIVSRMPRVHPRCGTNLAVAAMMFLSLMNFRWTPNEEARLLVAALVTLMVWRPLGSLLQFYITTKRPTPAQIEMGIAAGNDLLNRYASAPVASPSVLNRLAHSGMAQIMLGAFIVQGIAWALMQVLKVPESWRVFF